jgi:hypothetical protein
MCYFHVDDRDDCDYASVTEPHTFQDFVNVVKDSPFADLNRQVISQSRYFAQTHPSPSDCTIWLLLPKFFLVFFWGGGGGGGGGSGSM